MSKTSETATSEATVKRRHTESVLLRFEPDQLQMVEQAAKKNGLNRTAWIRMVLIRAAREEVGDGG